ncbi:hypothetical protein LIHA111178_11055 [Litorimonas haliclonae]
MGAKETLGERIRSPKLSRLSIGLVYCQNAHFCVHVGRASIFGKSSSSRSQVARLAKHMWASGRTSIGLSKLPAGTTNRVPFIWTLGTAEPHVEQKDFACSVYGTT